MKSWTIGPFSRPVDYPIIQPSPQLVFECPLKRQWVQWAENHTFNPAAIVSNNRVHLLFRAEDGHGDVIGNYCSRIGHGISDDGITIEVQPHPILYPDAVGSVDEWPGGCEDPRVIEDEDGRFVMYYTMFNRRSPVKIGVATSGDLRTWTKHGPIFGPECGNLGWHKAAGVVQCIHEGRLVATRIDGKYWMYWGENGIRLATSLDLVRWTPVYEADGEVLISVTPRRGYFDSVLTEIGPPPILTDDGIVLIYNGKNHPHDGDPAIGPGAYSVGQLLFDKNAPARVLDRLDEPFLKPELNYETTGQYAQGTVFAEGLVLFNNKWFLYYGTADTYVGVAVSQNGSSGNSV